MIYLIKRILPLSLLLIILFACKKEERIPKATIIINTNIPSKSYNSMIFGRFLEHFIRQIYGGVFEPGSPLSDEKGFRTDVIEALRELKVPVIRWPGGCFVDAYHWEKGVGPDREAYGDLRWGVIEPNTFGTDEFVELCRRLDGKFDAIMLSGDSPDASNDIEHPDRVNPEKIRLNFTDGVTCLPPHSLTIVHLNTASISK